MITFDCKKCGKQHRRPEAQSGTLVFCECGHGNRIPWPEEDILPVSAPTLADSPPGAAPLLDAQPVPMPPPASVPVADRGMSSRRPGRLIGKVNPNFCFQHDENPREKTCTACRLPFCGMCVVQLQGEVLCGPCKNFRLGNLGRPRRILPLAIVALVVSMASAPVAFTLSLAGLGIFLGEGLAAVALALCLVALVLPTFGLVLSGKALTRLEGIPEMSGRGLAASALCAGLLGVTWSVAVAVVILGKHALG